MMNVTPLHLRSNTVSVHEVMQSMREQQFIVDKPLPKEAAAQLIEGLLIRIPLPSIYVEELLDAQVTYKVWVGSHLLSSLWHYTENRVPLCGLEIFPELNGKLFNDLEGFLRRRIEETFVTINYAFCKDPILLKDYLRKLVLLNKHLLI